jgi:hypothetical protein
MTWDDFFDRMAEIQNEEPAWKLPSLGLALLAAYSVAFMIWGMFGVFVFPLGCLITWSNLYHGWTEWCFELGFLSR